MKGHVCITGISSGIGLALAQAAQDQGYRISGCARDSEVLDRLARQYPNWYLARANVATGEGLEAFILEATKRHGALQVVVCNAGHGCNGALADLPPEQLSQVLATNVVGVQRTVQAALPHCAPGALIQIVSSVVAYLPVPLMGAYCASKHAVEALSAALRMELQAQGLAVVTVCPGSIATDFFRRAAQEAGEAWQWRPAAPLAAPVLARAMLRQWRSRKARIFVPRSAGLMAWVYRQGPFLVEWFLRRALAHQRSTTKT